MYCAFNCVSDTSVKWPAFVEESLIQTYHLTADGCTVAKKLLCMVAKAHPEVSFSPTLSCMAHLLLHYHNEEQVCFSEYLMICLWYECFYFADTALTLILK